MCSSMRVVLLSKSADHLALLNLKFFGKAAMEKTLYAGRHAVGAWEQCWCLV